MNAQHTPGPWTAEVDEVVTITAPDGGRLAILGHLCGPHGSGGRRNSDEVAANARRIVQCVNAHDDLVALHQRHVESVLEIAQELRQPRLPLATVTAVSVRLLAEIAQESLAAIATATRSQP